MIKISLIVLCGLAAAMLLRRRSAALRHWVLAAAILCAGAMPLLEPIVPSLHVPLHPSLFGRTVEPLTLVIPVRVTQATEDLTAAPPSGFVQRMTVQRVLRWVWLAGAAISLSILFAGLARLGWLAARSRKVVSGPWTEMAARLSRDYGLRRPVLLLQSEHPSLLVTWGLRQPKIIRRVPRATGPKIACASCWATNSRTSAAATGSCTWRRSSCGRPTGSTRSCGSRAGACAWTASRHVTTPCWGSASKGRSTPRTCSKSRARSSNPASQCFPRRPWRAHPVSRGESGPC